MLSKMLIGDVRALAEPLEARRLLSATVLGPFPATPEVPAWAVAGEPIDSAPDAGEVELAALTGGNFAPFQDVPIPQRPTVIINWGDGTRALKTNSYVDTQNNRLTANVFGADQHRYRQPGTYLVHVRFVYQNHVIGKTVDRVRVLKDSPGSQPAVETAGTPFTAVLGTFTNDYFSPNYANVDWGDGAQSPAALRSLGNQQYEASGSHTFAHAGKYRVKVLVTSGPPAGSGIEAPTRLNAVLIVTTIFVQRRHSSPVDRAAVTSAFPRMQCSASCLSTVGLMLMSIGLDGAAGDAGAGVAGGLAL